MAFTTSFASQVITAEGFEALPLVTIGETIPNTTGALNSSTAGDFQPTGILDGAGAIQLDGDTVRAFVNSELVDEAGIPYTITQGTEDPGDDFVITGGRITYFDININSFEIEDSGIAYNTIVDANGEVATDIGVFGQVFADPEQGLEGGLRDIQGFSRFCSGGLIEGSEFGENRGIVDDIYFAGEEVGGFFNNIGGANWALDVATGIMHQVPALARGSWENTTQIDTGTDEFVAFVLADDQSPFNFDGDETTGDNGNEVAPLYLYVGVKDTSEDASFLGRNGLEGGQLYVFVPGVNEDGDDTNDILSAAQFNGTDFGLGVGLEGRWVPIDNFENPEQASIDGTTGFDQFGYPTQGNLFTQAASVNALGVSRPEDVATNPNNPSQVAQALTGVDTLAIDPETGNGADTFGQILTIDTFFDNLTPDSDLATVEIGSTVTIVYDGDTDPNRSLRSPDNLDFSADGYIYVQEDEAEEDTASGDEILFGLEAANPNEASIVRVDPSPEAVATAATGGNVELVAVIDRSQVFDPSVPSPTTAVDEDFEFGDDDGIASGNDVIVTGPTGEELILNAGEWETSGIVDVSDLFGFSEPGSVFLFDVQAHGLADQDEENLEQGELSALTDDNLSEGGQLLLLFGPEVTPETVVGTAGNDVLNGDADFAANDAILSGAGDDEIDLTLATTLTAPFGTSTTVAGSGSDIINAGDDNLVFGGVGDDVLSAEGFGSRLSGGEGDDTLLSISGGSNSLIGGPGSDTFIIDGGSDNIFAGSEDADTFIFASGTSTSGNTIAGFEVGVDVLEFGAAPEAVTAEGETISIDGTAVATLSGVDASAALAEAIFA